MTTETPQAALHLSSQLGLVERLRRGCTDWDGKPLGDPEPPMDALTVEDVREAAAEIENLRAALKWYADGEHFTKAEPDAWDTVSGEPQNWWCDEAGSAMVEDGSLAGMVLAGKLTGLQLQAMEDGEEA